MSIRYVTYDYAGHVYEVVNLFDIHGEPTTEPTKVSTCVIKLDDDHWLPQDADCVPIYTVH